MVRIILWLSYLPHLAQEKPLLQKIQQKYQSFKISVSHTTRSPRSNEIDGVDYFLFQKMIFQNLLNRKNFTNMQKYLEIFMEHLKKLLMKQ